MDFRNGRESRNVEDRRGQGGPHLGGRGKIGIGTLALGVFLAYMLVVGRRAARHGETGDLTEYEAGTPVLVAG